MRVPSEQTMESRDPLWPCVSSVRCMDGETIFAVTLGEGIYRKTGSNPWEQAGQGLPDNSKVNRLQLINDNLFACTNKGLFSWNGTHWEEAGLAVPCYQVISGQGGLAAATMYGVWYKTDHRWVNTAVPRSVVYDLYCCTDYMVLGTGQGISVYDRYTYKWAHFAQKSAVTGLAVYQGRLLGVTEKGELVIGNQQGGFYKASFPDLYIYAISSFGGDVYICSDRGLFQFDLVSGHLIIRSLNTCSAVTDIHLCQDRVYMATMCHGVQQLSI